MTANPDQTASKPPARGRSGQVLARPTLTKIVATVGPACDSPELIAKLIKAGVSVFRLNFSHGELDEHATRLATIRRVSERLGVHAAVLGDLQGPKIRVGKIETAGIELKAGQSVWLVPSARFAALAPQAPAGTAVLPSDYEPLATEAEPGHRVLINDGAVRLLAVPPEPGDPSGVLRAAVTVGGLVTSRKGINLPDTNVSAPAISDRDWACVEWAVSHDLDWLAMSFVRRAHEVQQLRERLAGMCAADRTEGDGEAGRGSTIPIIAKIEKPQAVEQIDAILEAADGIMVARGDLGVEMDLATVPIIQKRLIAKADEWGKPCIVATQMLESMTQAVAPTRAEATDVTNAILDGADAVMLSGETAVGKHPALVVETMRRIAFEAEREIARRERPASPSSRLRKTRYRTAALAHGAWHIARDIGARMVICWSQEGGTARYLAQIGLDIPVVAYSDSLRQVRRMSLLRGVTAMHMAVPRSGTLADWNVAVDRDALGRGWALEGDPVVLLAGKPLGKKGATNTLTIHLIGSRDGGFMAAEQS